ncbi:MAG: redoxin domain-containing protein [Deltaproteobacteria bacterium]|nr:redoxin domain-containing protein [Deltaproteobacteria bacterium]
MTDPSPAESPAPSAWGSIRRHWAAKLVRDLLIGAVLFSLALPVVGWLRAPDLPEVAPSFVLQDLNGKTVRLEDFRGQVVVLNFWATWCGPCRAEIPTFSRFAQRHPEVPVLGIAVDGSRAQLRSAQKSMGIAYPILLGDKATVAAYGASTLPTTVIVDEEGHIRTAHVGVMLPPHLWWVTR